MIVVESVADNFVAKFAEKTRTLIAGDPGAGATPLGAVVDRRTVDWVDSLIVDAVGLGAVRLTGETPAEGVLKGASVIDGDEALRP